jgi:hypothetical protein
MSKMIVRDLIEVGQQDSLFTSRGERLREDEGPADLERSAAGAGASSNAYRVKMRLFREYEDALMNGDHDQADELHEQLKGMHKGAATVAANESRAWMKRLRRGERSLLDALLESRGIHRFGG